MTYNDKGGGGSKLLEKLVTSLMDGPYLKMLLLLVMYGTVSDYLFFSVLLPHGLNVCNFFSKLLIQRLYQNIFSKNFWLPLWILSVLKLYLSLLWLECGFFVGYPFLIWGKGLRDIELLDPIPMSVNFCITKIWLFGDSTIVFIWWSTDLWITGKKIRCPKKVELVQLNVFSKKKKIRQIKEVHISLVKSYIFMAKFFGFYCCWRYLIGLTHQLKTKFKLWFHELLFFKMTILQPLIYRII